MVPIFATFMSHNTNSYTILYRVWKLLFFFFFINSLKITLELLKLDIFNVYGCIYPDSYFMLFIYGFKKGLK